MNHTQPLFTTQQPTLSNEMDGGADQMSSKHLTHSSRKRRLSGEHNASRKMVKSAQVSEKFATDFGESFMPLTLQWDGHDGRRMSVSKDIFNLICPAFGAMVSGKWADAIEDKIKMHDEDHPDALNHVMAAAHHRPAIWGADLQNPSIPTLIHLLILNDKYDIKFMKNQIFEWIEACQEDRRARGLPSSKYVKEDGLYRILAVWGVFTYGNQHQLFDCADVLSEVASNTRPDILRDFQLPQDGGDFILREHTALTTKLLKLVVECEKDLDKIKKTQHRATTSDVDYFYDVYGTTSALRAKLGASHHVLNLQESEIDEWIAQSDDDTAEHTLAEYYKDGRDWVDKLEAACDGAGSKELNNICRHISKGALVVLAGFGTMDIPTLATQCGMSLGGLT